LATTSVAVVMFVIPGRVHHGRHVADDRDDHTPAEPRHAVGSYCWLRRTQLIPDPVAAKALIEEALRVEGPTEHGFSGRADS